MTGKNELLASDTDLCARCGCYRMAHTNDDNRVPTYCNPVGWTFTATPALPEERADLIAELQARCGPNYAHSMPSELRQRLIAALTTPIASLPDEDAVERDLQLSWFDAMTAVVSAAWCAADDSSDDFDPETHVSVPNDTFEELASALDALENLIPESCPYTGVGALNGPVRAAISIPSTDGLREAAKDLIASRTDHYTARNNRRVSIEGDDGEKCWIVPFEAMNDLEIAISSLPTDKRPA